MLISVAQLGARMHYAVPRVFYQSGMLKRLYTDFYMNRKTAASFPYKLFKRIEERSHIEDIPPSKVKAFNLFGINYALKLRLSRTPTQKTATYLWGGQRFCELVIKHGLEDTNAIYTFNSSGLELMRYAKRKGIKCIMEQTIAPRKVEYSLVTEENLSFPGWAKTPVSDKLVEEFADREAEEWESADVIICGSDFVMKGIEKEGGPIKKVKVVPYGVDLNYEIGYHKSLSEKFNILFAGKVGLRKGIPYLVKAAELLHSKSFHFRAVGPIDLSGKGVQEVRKFIDLRGSVLRSEMINEYLWAHVFVLPSICEGSATVCYEALAAGLPVITTPNAGSIVRNGIDGFIVPIRDPKAIAEKIELLYAKPALWHYMSENAIQRAREFSIARYKERLLLSLLS